MLFKLISAKDGELVLSRTWRDQRGEHIVRASYFAKTVRIERTLNGANVQQYTARNTNEAELWRQVQAAAR